MKHTDLIQLCAERDSYRALYAKAWSDTSKQGREVDVIICPPSFGAATPHEQSRYWGYTCKFTLVLVLDSRHPISELTANTAHWNLLDYPGVVFPVTKVDPQLDPVDTEYVPKNEQDAFVHNMYSPETFADAPVSLQIIGRRQEDEKVIAALVEIERAMGRS
jgi:amidase